MTKTNHFLGASTALALLAALAASMVLMLFGPASPVQAQNLPSRAIAVNTADDENTRNNGQCSLREAVSNANLNRAFFPECNAGSATGEDTIIFDLPTSTITLSLGPLAATDSEGLIVDGDGNAPGTTSGSITLSGNNVIRVFIVESGANLGLTNLTVADSRTGDDGLGGGGVLNNGTLAVTNSTFTENSSVGNGGAIANRGTLTVTNSTFADNTATQDGGAIANATLNGRATVAYSTFSGNSAAAGGGGAIDNNGRSVTVSGTILANSPSGGNCSQTITDGRYNISDDQSCDFTSQTSRNSVDPELDTAGLQDNSGPTETIALQFSSPAAAAIPANVIGCGTDVEADQRGIERPQLSGCDIGAFEIFVGPGGSECTIEGTPGRDSLSGTPDNDVICGRGGSDTISGMGGDDAILGGSGSDTISGMRGDDAILGGSDPDTIVGASGADALFGGKGRDVLSGADGVRGNDTLNGQADYDVCLANREDELTSCEKQGEARLSAQERWRLEGATQG